MVAGAHGSWGGGGDLRPDQIFTVLAAVVLVVWLTVGGVFRDLQSDRYLVPMFGLAALSAAAGLQVVATRTRLGAAVLLMMCLGGFAAGQARWYGRLVADDSDRQIVACLEAQGVSAGIADYWIAYRMTFLSDERIIVVPDERGFDRYARYRAIVAAAPEVARIVRVSSPVASGVAVACASPTLRATIDRR